MPELPINTVPNPILKQKAQKVTDFGPDLRRLAHNMAETMRQNNGMGLAAPQVNVPKQLIVIEYEPVEPGETRIPLAMLTNPSVTNQSKERDWLNEGCLSIPGTEVPIERSIWANILAQDLDGNRVKIRAKDLHARIWLHDIDHLNGILMTDRAYPRLKELKGLRIIFLGTPAHATPYLSALVATDAQVVGVITETDKPSGRKQVLQAPPVKQLAETLKLPVFQFESLKSGTAYKRIKALKPDVAIVVAYGQIIPQKLLALPRLGFLNVHYSLLPALRGPSPHQNAIWQGFNETGYTIFKLDAGIDTGPIITQRKIVIDSNDTSQTLLEKMMTDSVATLLETLPAYVSGEKKPRLQIDTQASQTKLLRKEDGRIDWQRSVAEIDRQIRAMQPWPAAYTEFDNQRLVIHAAHIEGQRLVIDVVQPAGKQPMTFADYLRANQVNRLTFFRETGKVRLD